MRASHGEHGRIQESRNVSPGPTDAKRGAATGRDRRIYRHCRKSSTESRSPPAAALLVAQGGHCRARSGRDGLRELRSGDLGRFRLGRLGVHRRATCARVERNLANLVLAWRNQERRTLLAACLLQLLAGAQAMGIHSHRLPRCERAPAWADLPAPLAAHAGFGGTRRLADRRRVRGSPSARRIGGLGDRAQGLALRPVLPCCHLGLASIHEGPQVGALLACTGSVCRRDAIEVDCRHPAGGSRHPALVEEGRVDLDGCAAARSVLRRGGIHCACRPAVLPRARRSLARLFPR